LRIVVSAAVTTPATALAVLRNGRITTADGAILKIDLVRADLAEPADLAFTPDRRLIVAESRGIIRIEPTASVPELTPNDVDGSLLAVALDPAFAATEQVFALSVASDGASANRTFTLARFREHEGRLIDRVVLLDGIPAASDPHGTIRFGPDGKLYVALDDGGSAASASDLSSENGKVLRLERDATTPADQDGLTPVFAHALHAPRALAFQPSTGELLVADQTPRGDELLLAIGRTRPRVRGVVRAAFRLPPPTTGAAALFYSSAAIPQFTGNLFVASDDGEHLLRLVFDPKNPSRIASTERLLRNTIGPLRAMAAAPDGSIYVATDVALWRLAAN
jgi:glucose/arabinose dehydrogenase